MQGPAVDHLECTLILTKGRARRGRLRCQSTIDIQKGRQYHSMTMGRYEALMSHSA